MQRAQRDSSECVCVIRDDIGSCCSRTNGVAFFATWANDQVYKVNALRERNFENRRSHSIFRSLLVLAFRRLVHRCCVLRKKLVPRKQRQFASVFSRLCWAFLREAFDNALLCLCTNAYTIARKLLRTFEPDFDMHTTMYKNKERGTCDAKLIF